MKRCTAELANPFVAGTKIEMICVAEQNLHAKFGERLLRQSLHRSSGAHRHERWRIDHAVRRRQAPEPRTARIGFQNFEVEFHPCESSRAMQSCRGAPLIGLRYF
jgi:hypothetical protein